MHISAYIQSISDSFRTLFGLQDEMKRGRTCMVGASIVGSIISGISSGIFYTGFLLGNHIDLTGIGVITFIPYLASLVSLAAPYLLERFAHRRRLLALLRALQWTVQLLGMTLLPMLVKDPSARIVCFCIISFMGTALSCLCTSGFTPWHLNFIPDQVRASYFMFCSFLTNTISGLFLIFSGLIADALAGSPHQMTIILALRYIAFGLALLEVWLLVRPKEFPYARRQTRPSPSQVFILPLRNGRFLKTEGINLLYLFVMNLTASVLNAWLLDSIGVSYTLINLVNTLYSFFLLLFGPFWQRRIGRLGWLRTLSLSLLALAPTYVLYMLIRPDNFFWLFLIMRLIQHFIGVGQNTCVSNLLYLNMPEEERSSFVSFHTVVSNLAVLVSMMLGTGFVSLMGDRVLTLGSLSFSSIPLLLGATAVGCLLLALLIRRQAPKLEPLD